MQQLKCMRSPLGMEGAWEHDLTTVAKSLCPKFVTRLLPAVGKDDRTSEAQKYSILWYKNIIFLWMFYTGGHSQPLSLKS